MAGFTDDGLTQYCYNTHLRMMEAQVFNLLAGRSTDGYARMAREDVRRDLRRFGYIDPIEPISTATDARYLSTTQNIRGEIRDRSARALANITLTLAAGAEEEDEVIPAGTILQDLDPYGDNESQVALDSATGALRWETLADVTVARGGSASVAVRATVPGAPHNLCTGSAEASQRGRMWFASSALNAVAELGAVWGTLTTPGVDHQLARLTTYSALVYAYTDLMGAKDDPMDAKRLIYEKRYKAELDRLIASGVEITQDGNAETTPEEDRLRYGQIRLWRS